MERNLETKAFILKDKEKFERIRKKYEYNTAAYSFISFYIWRDTLKFSLYMEDDIYSVLCGSFGENTWTFPCGGHSEKKAFISKMLKSNDFEMVYLRQEDKDFLENNFPNMFHVEENIDCNEYIYDRLAWEELKGSKYGAMRNHIRRAVRDNELRVEQITPENVHEVYEIIESWDSYNGNLGSLGDSDKTATTQLILNYEELQERGILVYVNGEPCAVVAGFSISDNMFDMCLAKQKRNIPGLSVYSKYMFVTSLPENYKIINAEDDLGIEGLREMKKQMQPIGQIKSFIAKRI